MNSLSEHGKQYTVEEGVPVPPKKYVRKSKYPFVHMQPNQSVLIEGKSYNSLMGVLRKYKAEGKKFIVRQVEQGLRVWRLE